MAIPSRVSLISPLFPFPSRALLSLLSSVVLGERVPQSLLFGVPTSPSALSFCPSRQDNLLFTRSLLSNKINMVSLSRSPSLHSTNDFSARTRRAGERPPLYLSIWEKKKKKKKKLWHCRLVVLKSRAIWSSSPRNARSSFFSNFGVARKSLLLHVNLWARIYKSSSRLSLSQTILYWPDEANGQSREKVFRETSSTLLGGTEFPRHG